MQIYTARGLGRDGFDPEQLKEAEAIGLKPQPLFFLNALGTDIFDGFGYYAGENGLENLPAHGYGQLFGHQYNDGIFDLVEAVVKMNREYSKPGEKPLIHSLCFHAGSLKSHEEVHRSTDGLEGSRLITTFTADEYEKALNKCRERYEQLKEIAENGDVEILIETTEKLDFDKIVGDEEKPYELTLDPRFGDSPWLPYPIEVGHLGWGNDLLYIVGEEGRIVVDTEHISQTEENIKNTLGVLLMGVTPNLGKYGMHIEYGKAVQTSYFNSINFIRSLPKGKCPVAHIGGQTQMSFHDVIDGTELKVIGSHMPITFEGDPNEFTNVSKKKLELDREVMVSNYIRTLREVGCEKLVLEMHIGEHVGEKWRYYNDLSAKNVLKILEEERD